MSEPMIWSYLLHLSTHMWADGSKESKVWYLNEPVYTENNNVDLDVWDSTIQFLGECKYNMVIIDVGDAIQYESHPEISAPDAWSKDFLKQKLNEIRALGMEPIPKLNFSACHHTWLKQYSRMLSSPIYHQVCADLIAEVCEAFDYPRFFHLGFDEENAQWQISLEKAIVRGEKLWWGDLFFMAKECEKHGARPWVWSDYFWYHPDLFKKNMPKSILQSNWFYDTMTDHPVGSFIHTELSAYVELDELGYDQVLTGSTWRQDSNLYQTVAHGKERISPELLKGFMAAPWEMTVLKNRYTLMDDAFRMYLARKELYPQTL